MSFADRDGWIWFDGEMVPWREAKVHVLTHTLHYGLGVFEGVRAQGERSVGEEEGGRQEGEESEESEEGCGGGGRAVTRLDARATRG